MSPPLLRRCPDKAPCWDAWALVRGVLLQAPTHLCPNCSCSLPPRAQHFWWEFTAGLKAAMSGGPQRPTRRADSRGWALISPLPIQHQPAQPRPGRPILHMQGPLSSSKDPLSLPGLFSWAAPIPVIDGYYLTVSSHC